MRNEQLCVHMKSNKFNFLLKFRPGRDKTINKVVEGTVPHINFNGERKNIMFALGCANIKGQASTWGDFQLLNQINPK